MTNLISIHALQAESDDVASVTYCICSISIHALQAESDDFLFFLFFTFVYFNPRSPSGERLLSSSCFFWYSIFQSTLSKRRATSASVHTCVSPLDFNPRSPSGERLSTTSYGFPLYLFQSTLSKRRATQSFGGLDTIYKISIHALQAESDFNLVQYPKR